MALSTLVWVSILVSLLLLPGVVAMVLVRPLHTEGRRLALLREQDDVDSYSPRALLDLREWIRANPDDPYSPVTRRRYNKYVRSLRAIDEPHYNWSDGQIARLELVDEWPLTSLPTSPQTSASSSSTNSS